MMLTVLLTVWRGIIGNRRYCIGKDVEASFIAGVKVVPEFAWWGRRIVD
jgi:hypothetical protein